MFSYVILLIPERKWERIITRLIMDNSTCRVELGDLYAVVASKALEALRSIVSL